MISRAAVAAALVMFAGMSGVAAGQRRVTNTSEKPKVDIVQSVGCAERKAGSPATWWLGRAADATVSQPGVFTVAQVEQAKGAALGASTFQLVGVADFLDTAGLLQSGQRADFTTAENANASGQLKEGRKVLVKGLLIDGGDVKRINLMSVISLAESCS
jgi:hypothetical protein